MKTACILLVIAISLIYQAYAMIDLKTEEEFHQTIRNYENLNLFVVFCDSNEICKDEILPFWKRIERGNGLKGVPESLMVVYVDVKKLSNIQYGMDVDDRGTTILFRKSREQFRFLWLGEEEVIEIVSALTVIPQLQQLSIKDFDKFDPILVHYGKQVETKKAMVLESTIEHFDGIDEEKEELFTKFRPQFEKDSNTEFFFYKENNPETGMRFQYLELSEDKSDIALTNAIKVVRNFLFAQKRSTLHSVKEANPDTFREFSDIYKFVCIIPYANTEIKEQIIEQIEIVEKLPDFPEFGFLYLNANSTRYDYPLCFEMAKVPSYSRDYRSFWDPELPFNAENLKQWLKKIQLGTLEEFTEVILDDTTHPVITATDKISQLSYKKLKKLSSGTHIILFYRNDELASELYDALVKLTEVPELQDFHFHIYDVFSNKYTGPPGSSILGVQNNGKLKYVDSKQFDAPYLTKRIFNVLSKLNRDEL